MIVMLEVGSGSGIVDEKARNRKRSAAVMVVDVRKIPCRTPDPVSPASMLFS